jgi:glycosyltransferase involved in cell wall biosynthesis
MSANEYGNEASRKLRLLYSSNAFWCNSGYGVQSKSLLPRLAELPQFGGRDAVAQHAWYGIEGGIHQVEGFRVYPKFDDPYGNDVVGAHTRHFGANVVITLIDVWVLKNTAQAIAPALFCPWLPIDHDPLPQIFLDSLAGAHLPLTYAKWGHKMLTDAGVENVYIPHGIESQIFKVLPERAFVQQFKRSMTGLDESFLCVMVAANKGFPDRKWFQGQLEAFKEFKKDKPNARLYIHTIPTAVHGGIDFPTLVQRLGMDWVVVGENNPKPSAEVIFPHPYIYRLGFPPEYLTAVYNAADVLLAASMSEGFGIPIIEAQACGTPVITTNFSAMPELLRWGYLVDVDDMMMTGMHSYQAWPSKRSMIDKLDRLYDSWLIAGGDWPMSKRFSTSQAIHAEYDWDTIVRDQWMPLVERLAEEAPPLDERFQANGVSVPDPQPQDDVQGFVDAIQEDMAKERPARRVAPLRQAVTA